jgi:hypothetical protein
MHRMTLCIFGVLGTAIVICALGIVLSCRGLGNEQDSSSWTGWRYGSCCSWWRRERDAFSARTARTSHFTCRIERFTCGIARRFCGVPNRRSFVEGHAASTSGTWSDSNRKCAQPLKVEAGQENRQVFGPSWYTVFSCIYFHKTIQYTIFSYNCTVFLLFMYFLETAMNGMRRRRLAVQKLKLPSQSS